MKLRIILDTGDSPVVERDKGTPFATRCMEIAREGFTTEDLPKKPGLVYIPGSRVRHIELVETS